jgi:Spy/CpxP family protein refolding chaperone
MKRRVLALVCGLGLLSGYCGMACADRDDGDMSGKHEKMAQKIDKELNLSAEQREQLKSFRADQQTVMKDIRKQLAEKRLAMKEELVKPDSDKDVIDQLSADIKQLTGQEIDLHTAAMLKMKEVLTQEQFKKFLEMMDKRMKNRPAPGKD